MKFELLQYNRDATDDQLLDDLRKIAHKLNKKTLTIADYEKIGRFHPSTISRRFGGWTKAIKNAGLNSERKNRQVGKSEIILDLQLVARKLKKQFLTSNEYTNYGKYTSSTIRRKFGSWNNALQSAGLNIAKISHITDEELFQNLKIIWTKLGKQPKYGEILKPLSDYSRGTYEHRFGTWRKALEAFVKFINNEEKIQIKEDKEVLSILYSKHSDKDIVKHKTKRTINWRLRFLVLRRDNFKCVIDGRSPATHLGITLHVDHINPWDKGGETVFENLQTLCSICNIGKSNLDMHNLDNNNNSKSAG